MKQSEVARRRQRAMEDLRNGGLAAAACLVPGVGLFLASTMMDADPLAMLDLGVTIGFGVAVAVLVILGITALRYLSTALFWLTASVLHKGDEPA